MTDLISRLVDALGERNVITGDAVRERDPGLDPENMNASALVRPGDTEEVSTVLRLCNEVGQSVVTHGGLTGAVQGTVTTSDDIILSLERMDTIESLDTIGRTITAQAGVTLQSVQEAAEESDLIFPLDIGSRGSCTIGGNIATNAGGIQVIRYGMMRALVSGLEIVLPDGRIVSSLDTMMKNNTGYDLKQVFIGSEGTLGVVTRAVLRLSEQPKSKRAALVATDSMGKLLELLQYIQGSLGSRLGGFEVMWREYYEFATSASDFEPPLPNGYPAYSIIEGLCNHESDHLVFEHALEHAFNAELISDGVVAKSERERDSFWALRDSFMKIVAAYPDIIDLDTSVPIVKTESYIEEARAKLSARFPELVLLLHGHIGDGNLHPLICGEGITNQMREEIELIFYEPLWEIGGAVSAEHGVGIERKKYLHLSRSQEEIELMQLFKKSIDPNNILNPGKVLP
jgi:FAD/FMN-containing dehydrogenase